MGQEFLDHMVTIASELNDEIGGIKKKVEGKVPRAKSDDEPTKIKKMTEQDDLPAEDEDEEEEAFPRKRPSGDVPEEEETKIEKMYFGSKGDDHFYMNETSSDSGERNDLQIIDVDGNTIFSAHDNGIDINDVLVFVVEATRQVDIDEVSRDVIVKYVFPALEEEEKEEEETIPSEGEETPKPGLESKVVFEDKEYSVKMTPDINKLLGEGISEATLTIGDQDFTFSSAFIQQYCDDKGVVTMEGVERLATDVLQTNSGLDTDVDSVDEEGTRTNEDLSSDVKAMAKAAKTALDDEDYVKASDLVMKLAQVQNVTPKAEDDTKPKNEEELEVKTPGEKETPEKDTEEGKIPDKDDDEPTKIDKLKEEDKDGAEKGEVNDKDKEEK